MLTIRILAHAALHTVKKSVDFTVKYLGAWHYYYGRLLVKHVKKSRYGRVMLTDSTRKYLCRVEGLFDPNNTSPLLPYFATPENVYGRL